MPIRRELRPLYPPHWRSFGAQVRFERAGGQCQACGRPHLEKLRCLPDGAAAPSGGGAGNAGKKVHGRKRQLLVDTDGRTLILQVQAASVQDRDDRRMRGWSRAAVGRACVQPRRRWPFIARAFVDARYAGQRVAQATSIAIEVVRKPADQVGFAVHPRRWVVGRTFAWLGRNRRLSKDYETLTPSSEALLYAASSITLLRRLGRC